MVNGTTPVPELPEVETVRRGLEPVMVGTRILRVEARRPDLRAPLPRDFAERVEGETVLAMGRRAKYLTAELASGDVLLMHLGMSGSFRVSRDGEETRAGRGLAPPPRLTTMSYFTSHRALP